jgi:hypothetical protein
MPPERIEAKDRPVVAVAKPESPPRPGPPVKVKWNDSEAAAREPIVEKPKLRLTPHED